MNTDQKTKSASVQAADLFPEIVAAWDQLVRVLCNEAVNPTILESAYQTIHDRQPELLKLLRERVLGFTNLDSDLATEAEELVLNLNDDGRAVFEPIEKEWLEISSSLRTAINPEVDPEPKNKLFLLFLKNSWHLIALAREELATLGQVSMDRARRISLSEVAPLTLGDLRWQAVPVVNASHLADPDDAQGVRTRIRTPDQAAVMEVTLTRSREFDSNEGWELILELVPESTAVEVEVSVLEKMEETRNEVGFAFLDNKKAVSFRLNPRSIAYHYELGIKWQAPTSNTQQSYTIILPILDAE